MNEILLAVTGLSLLVAGFMSAMAWRMTREARQRYDARIAALSSAIYEKDGALISTGRAAVPAGRLGPGATTPFVVSIAGAASVDRFRLSFRTDARIEPHVDRRTS